MSGGLLIVVILITVVMQAFYIVGEVYISGLRKHFDSESRPASGIQGSSATLMKPPLAGIEISLPSDTKDTASGE